MDEPLVPTEVPSSIQKGSFQFSFVGKGSDLAFLMIKNFFLSTHPIEQDRIKSLRKDVLKESKIKILEYQEWVSLRAPCY